MLSTSYVCLAKSKDKHCYIQSTWENMKMVVCKSRNSDQTANLKKLPVDQVNLP